MDRLTAPTGPRCRCGESVPRTVARVFGDEDGVVPACPECYTNRHGKGFESTMQAIQSYRTWHDD